MFERHQNQPHVQKLSSCRMDGICRQYAVIGVSPIDCVTKARLKRDTLGYQMTKVSWEGVTKYPIDIDE